MAQHTIIIRDENGAGRTGLNVKLKKFDDGIFVDYATGEEVSGKPGVYAFEDVIYSRYKLFVNDVEEPSFDGSSADGRFFGGRISEIVTDLDATDHKIKNMANGTEAKDAVNKTQLDGKMDKTGGDFTGDVSMSGKRLKGAPAQDESTDSGDYASVGLVLGVNSYVGENYIHFPNNIIIVDSLMSVNILGRKYTKIQDAINYAKTKTPSGSNHFNILIFPGSYTEDITLQPFINLMGIFGKPLITGTITGGNSNTRVRNLTFTYLGNYSLTSLRAANTTFRVTNDDTGYILTITNCILNNCSLVNVGDAEFNPKIVSGGNNVFLNCLSNIPCNLIAGDKGSINSIESVTTDFS